MSDECSESSHDHHYEPGDFKMFDLQFSHNSVGYQLWTKMVNTLCLLSSFIYAHYAAFRHSDPSLSTTMVVVEMIFFCDLVLTFITTIEDPMNPG